MGIGSGLGEKGTQHKQIRTAWENNEGQRESPQDDTGKMTKNTGNLHGMIGQKSQNGSVGLYGTISEIVIIFKLCIHSINYEKIKGLFIITLK